MSAPEQVQRSLKATLEMVDQLLKHNQDDGDAAWFMAAWDAKRHLEEAVAATEDDGE